MTGLVWIRSAFRTPAAAFDRAQDLTNRCVALGGRDELSVIGDFILPRPNGGPTRDFQTLHFDFGLPVHPQRDQDVGR